MKRSKLTPGDIFEISTLKGFGYARVLGKDDFGTMFEISSECSPTALTELQLHTLRFLDPVVVYVNAWAAKNEWAFRVRVPPENDKLPISFWGTPKTGWHIKRDSELAIVNAKTKSYQQMVDDGYVGRTLWLPKAIKAYLEEKKPLIWSTWPE